MLSLAYYTRSGLGDSLFLAFLLHVQLMSLLVFYTRMQPFETEVFLKFQEKMLNNLHLENCFKNQATVTYEQSLLTVGLAFQIKLFSFLYSHHPIY